MLDKLKNSNIKIGLKQTLKIIKNDLAETVFIAKDAESFVTREILELSKEKNIKVEYVETMKALGEAVSIEVGAATAVIIKEN